MKNVNFQLKHKEQKTKDLYRGNKNIHEKYTNVTNNQRNKIESIDVVI